jgi:hypothetical protein
MSGLANPEPGDGLTRRVTDAERSRAANAVDAAVTDGRLTWTEHSERSGQIWAAQTRGELMPALAGLGPVRIDPLQVQRVSAVCSKVSRAISAATQEVHASAVFGAIVLDLTAMRPGQEIDVQASSFCGKVLIMVADDATVIDQGDVLLGKRSALRTAVPTGGPVVRLAGRSAFGNLKVRRAGEGLYGEHGDLFGAFGPAGGFGAFGGAGRGERHLHLHRDQHIHYHGGAPVPGRRRDRTDRQQWRRQRRYEHGGW